MLLGISRLVGVVVPVTHASTEKMFASRSAIMRLAFSDPVPPCEVTEMPNFSSNSGITAVLSARDVFPASTRLSSPSSCALAMSASQSSLNRIIASGVGVLAGAAVTPGSGAVVAAGTGVDVGAGGRAGWSGGWVGATGCQHQRQQESQDSCCEGSPQSSVALETFTEHRSPPTDWYYCHASRLVTDLFVLACLYERRRCRQ